MGPRAGALRRGFAGRRDPSAGKARGRRTRCRRPLAACGTWSDRVGLWSHREGQRLPASRHEQGEDDGHQKSAGTSPIRWPWLPGANDWNVMMRPWMTLDQIVNWMRLRFASGSRAAAIRKSAESGVDPDDHQVVVGVAGVPRPAGRPHEPERVDTSRKMTPTRKRTIFSDFKRVVSVMEIPPFDWIGA